MCLGNVWKVVESGAKVCMKRVRHVSEYVERRVNGLRQVLRQMCDVTLAV